MFNSRLPVMATCLLLAIASVATSPLSAQDFMNESPNQRDARLAWWRDARFGMFIHWGLYAVPAGEYQGKRSNQIGEWIQAWADVPRDDYDQFAAQFNPIKFDAAEWVRIARDAGQKYIVITSKHHDGFCLWDSVVTDWDVVDATPYKKDLLAQLAAECEKQDVRMCFYYSILDWHHPSQFVKKNPKDKRHGYAHNHMHPGRKAEYVQYMKDQLKELVTRYDPHVLWFDGEWVPWWTHEDGVDLYNYCRTLKPSLIVNNRVDKGRQGMAGLNKKDKKYAGDFGTPEQEIPGTGLPGVDWETCMTMNDTWGYKHYDDNWKSNQVILRQLIDATSKGGNYLLNVGPTAEGLIPQPSVERLAAVGRWMNTNGESIYGTQASPFGKLAWGRATHKPGKLYLHVFDWPADRRLAVPAVKNKIAKAYLLSDAERQPLAVEAGENSLKILVPGSAPHPITSVIVLEFEGDVELAEG